MLKKIFLIICVHTLSLSIQAQNIEENCNESRSKYLEENPDVAKARMDPWSHYTIYGKREGRKWFSCNESISNPTISNNNLQVNSKIKFEKFDDFLNFYKSVNSSNVEFNGSTSNPPNPSESIYKRDFYNNQLIYEGYYKEIIKQNYGSTIYKETIKHGEGKTYMTNSDGYIEGYYVNGKLNGYGTHRSPSIGYTYKGYFVNNQKQGLGVVVNDGLQGTTKYFYEGNFLNNNYEGKGTIIYDFMAFVGEFNNGKMINGTAYYPNNQMYKGAFLNENFHGNGEYYFSDGSKYIGEFNNGKYHGFGELYYPDGSILYKGGFYEGKYHSFGVLYNSDSSRTGGIWQTGNLLYSLPEFVNNPKFYDFKSYYGFSPFEIVFEVSFNSKRGVINKNGKEIIPTKYDILQYERGVDNIKSRIIGGISGSDILDLYDYNGKYLGTRSLKAEMEQAKRLKIEEERKIAEQRRIEKEKENKALLDWAADYEKQVKKNREELSKKIHTCQWCSTRFKGIGFSMDFTFTFSGGTAVDGVDFCSQKCAYEYKSEYKKNKKSSSW